MSGKLVGFARRPVLWAAALAVIALMVAPAGGMAAPSKFVRVTTLGVGPFPDFGMQRSANGRLNLIFQTTAPGSSAPNGLATRSISPGGALSPQTQALSGWTPGRPGLVVLPGGALEAVFGAVSPPPTQVGGLWAISSVNGGGTWGAPASVGSGSLEDLAYGSDITAQRTGTTPVLTVPQAGGVVVQQGLGLGSPTQLVTDATDNFAGDVNTAVDAASGAVVASWQSLAGSGGDFIRAVAPTLGATVRAPGPARTELVLAGRDSGPGVFGAYSPDGGHVRLLRYGGGSVAVGRVTGLSANVLGVATGLDGRVWVLWGQDGLGVAVTRSNRAVTRFEPIQRLNPHPFTLYRLSGDGRLGPLDLLVDQIPTGKGSVPPAGTFYGRVFPELSVKLAGKAVKNKSGHVIAHKLTARVLDAGDAVSGATVSARGHKATTNAKGIATLTLPGAGGGRTTVTVTHAGYRQLKTRITL